MDGHREFGEIRDFLYMNHNSFVKFMKINIEMFQKSALEKMPIHFIIIISIDTF